MGSQEATIEVNDKAYSSQELNEIYEEVQGDSIYLTQSNGGAEKRVEEARLENFRSKIPILYTAVKDQDLNGNLDFTCSKLDSLIKTVRKSQEPGPCELISTYHTQKDEENHLPLDLETLARMGPGSRKKITEAQLRELAKWDAARLERYHSKNT